MQGAWETQLSDTQGRSIQVVRLCADRSQGRAIKRWLRCLFCLVPASRVLTLTAVRACRRRRVRDRIQALGGRAEAAHGGADVGAPGASDVDDVGAGAPLAGGDGAQQLRAPLQDQGGGRQRGRVPRHVGRVEDPRREVLPLDRRVPPVGGPKGNHHHHRRQNARE
jgi:hypothetical protein